MGDTIEAEICVMGAGPVGGTLACRLAAAGVSTVVVDRAALPPMENPAFDGRAYAIAAGSRDLLVAAGRVGPPASAPQPDPGYPRQRWAARPPGVPAASCISTITTRARMPVRSAGWSKRAACAWR